MSEQKGLNRRQFITKGGLAVAGATLAVSGLGALLTACSPEAKPPAVVTPVQPEVPKWPFTWTKLDTKVVEDRAYKKYGEAGWGFGAADGLIGTLQDKVGYPFTLIPTQSYTYGSGGFYGWGSLCGALSSAVAVINLFHDTAVSTTLSNELFAWYSQAAFPMYKTEFTLPTTVADSTLCHVSVTKFMDAAGVARATPERKARCGALTADVAKFTVELLNAQADGTFVSKYKPAAVVGACMSCHSTDSHGKENCTPCHGDPHGK